MSYTVKEIFYTLQGEGHQSGRAAVFCRFSGCNLWSGREEDRPNAACPFCDTDFVGVGVDGGKFSDASALAQKIAATWQGTDGIPYVVFTGGEPLLQLDIPLIEAMHTLGFEVAVETNGTLPAPSGIDWICVSPKGNNPLQQTSGHELKLVYPQVNTSPQQFEDLEFQYFYLQPMDDAMQTEHIRASVAYCMLHPKWQLSLQTHKLIGVR